MNEIHYGVVLGRFQPLHLGHMEYLEAARMRCRRLVIGITNPDTSTMRYEPSNPGRSERVHNPFPYFIRHEMMMAALKRAGWSHESFAIVPADVNDYTRAAVCLPPPGSATVFITIYDQWGEEKRTRVQSLGYAAEVLWRRSMSDRFTTGSHVRELMRAHGPWQPLVPPGVAEYFQANSEIADQYLHLTELRHHD